jgi:hypothetical protein
VGDHAEPRPGARSRPRRGSAAPRRGTGRRRRRLGGTGRTRPRSAGSRAGRAARPAPRTAGKGGSAKGRPRGCPRAGAPGRRRAHDRRRRPAPCDGHPVVPRRCVERRARHRRPLRRPPVDATASPARKPNEPSTAPAEHRPSGSGHAVRDAAATRPGARAASRRRRLRGRDETSEGGARERLRGRLGPYPSNLRRRVQLVSRTPRLRPRARSARTVQRTTTTVAHPIAIPNRLPTSTSDQ